MKRIYHNYKKWEDWQYGMYSTTCFMDSHQLIHETALMLKCPEWLNESMMFVVCEWPFATEANLTNMSRNRQAWLGQAASCMIHGSPEYITKLAWHTLTDKEKKAANNIADDTLDYFDSQYSEGRMLWQK